VETLAGDVLEEPSELPGAPGLHLASGCADLGRVGKVGGVPLHEVPADCVGESLAEDSVDVPDSLGRETARAILAATFEQLGVEAVESRRGNGLKVLGAEGGQHVQAKIAGVAVPRRRSDTSLDGGQPVVLEEFAEHAPAGLNVGASVESAKDLGAGALGLLAGGESGVPLADPLTGCITSGVDHDRPALASLDDAATHGSS
jgi:hypothetical protein